MPVIVVVIIAEPAARIHHVEHATSQGRNDWNQRTRSHGGGGQGDDRSFFHESLSSVFRRKFSVL
jgi:hypothetical protein